MKTYTIEFEDKVAKEIDVIASETAKVSSEAFLQLLIVKAIAPWHKLAKDFGQKVEDIKGELG